jgi:hypothetical protein
MLGLHPRTALRKSKGRFRAQSALTTPQTLRFTRTTKSSLPFSFGTLYLFVPFVTHLVYLQQLRETTHYSVTCNADIHLDRHWRLTHRR